MGIQRRRKQPTTRQFGLGRVIEQAKIGNDDAIGVLYRNHVGMVYGYLLACGAPDPEDLTAEVFLGVLRNIRSFDGGPSEFRSWLMTIAYRRMVDARRHRAVVAVDLYMPESFDGIESSRPQELMAVEIDAELIEAFATLTEPQREVLALRFVADLGLDRVAEITSRPVGAVKSMQYRALAALRAALPDPLDAGDEAMGQ